jgi:hypothetical protein
LAQCVEEGTGEILWLCEKHRDGYRSRQTESETPPSYSPRDSSDDDGKKSYDDDKKSYSILMT